MVTAKKICEGCEQEKHIWKRVEGKPYCLYCYLHNFSPKKPFKIVPPKPVNPRSQKRAAQEREYSLVRKRFLILHPYCEAKVHGCTMMATEIHHKKGRIGDLLTDHNHFLAVCHSCHEFIEANPLTSKDMGFSQSRLTKDLKNE